MDNKAKGERKRKGSTLN